MKKKKKDYHQEDLGGLTKNQLDNMSNYELKEFQRKQSDEEIYNFKSKLKNSIVGAVFFSLLAVNLFFNPFFIDLSFIAPIVLVAVLSLRAYITKANLDVAKTGRVALELFFREIGV